MCSISRVPVCAGLAAAVPSRESSRQQCQWEGDDEGGGEGGSGRRAGVVGDEETGRRRSGRLHYLWSCQSEGCLAFCPRKPLHRSCRPTSHSLSFGLLKRGTGGPQAPRRVSTTRKSPGRGEFLMWREATQTSISLPLSCSGYRRAEADPARRCAQTLCTIHPAPPLDPSFIISIFIFLHCAVSGTSDIA